LGIAIALVILAIGFFFCHFALKIPPRPLLFVFGGCALTVLVIYAAILIGQNRGLLPRARPIKPFNSISHPAASESELPKEALDQASMERIIEDYIETVRSLIRSERYEEASELLSKALDLDPGNSRLLNFVGICCSRMTRYDDAVKAYEASIEQDYDNASSHFNLAVALENAERIAEAIEQYQRYLKVGKILGEPVEMLSRASERLDFLRGLYNEKE